MRQAVESPDVLILQTVGPLTVAATLEPWFNYSPSFPQQDKMEFAHPALGSTLEPSAHRSSDDSILSVEEMKWAYGTSDCSRL